MTDPLDFPDFVDIDVTQEDLDDLGITIPLQRPGDVDLLSVGERA